MKLTPINGNTETEGSKLVYRGVELLVARSGNTNFQKLFRELLKPFKEDFDAGRLGEEQSNEIMIECVSRTILVGWNNFKDVDGVAYEYSQANAKELLSDDKDVYNAVMKHSENIDNYLIGSNEALQVK